jgi:hypothetical protein
MTVLGANFASLLLLGVTTSGGFFLDAKAETLFSSADSSPHLTVAALPSSASLFFVKAAHHSLGDLL